MAKPVLFQKLQAWQGEHDYSDSKLADEIGVNPTTIWRAKRGLRVLGMEHQLAIQMLTKKVSPADWAEFYALTIHLRPKKLTAQKKSAVAEEAA